MELRRGRYQRDGMMGSMEWDARCLRIFLIRVVLVVFDGASRAYSVRVSWVMDSVQL